MKNNNNNNITHLTNNINIQNNNIINNLSSQSNPQNTSSSTSSQQQTQPQLKYPLDYVSSEIYTQEDILETQYIENILRNDYNLFESEEESKLREEILNSLGTCVKNAVYKMAIELNYPEDSALEAGGKIFTFGSYRLGIVGPGDDIDVLCVGPDFCERDKFYKKMVEELEKEKKITQIFKVDSAYVPIIKIVFNNIPIDILVARLSKSQIGKNLTSLEDDSILKNCDEKCILSLNGCRVTDKILSIVSQVIDTNDFKLTLRAIKLWAKKRGIYSNSFGFPGGVAWAILVVKVCQTFPKLKPNKLIRKFFDFYANWDWANPIIINKEEINKVVDFDCPVEVWKIEKQKNKCKFYIITPSFPVQNTNYNTNEITKRVMIDEFKYFYDFTQKIDYKNKNEKKFTWFNLFKEFDIFNSFECLLEVDVLGRNQNDFKYWDGYIESHLRYLINDFILFPQIKLRPYTNHLGLKDNDFEFQKNFFFGIDFEDPNIIFEGLTDEEKEKKKIIDLRQIYKKFIHQMNIQRRNKETMNLRVSIRTIDNLPEEIKQKYLIKKT